MNWALEVPPFFAAVAELSLLMVQTPDVWIPLIHKLPWDLPEIHTTYVENHVSDWWNTEVIREVSLVEALKLYYSQVGAIIYLLFGV